MDKRILSFIIVVVTFIIVLSPLGFCEDIPGLILYEKDGAVFSIQPDGRGNKKLADNARGPLMPSPDASRYAFVMGSKIFLIKPPKYKVQLIYQGKDNDEIFLVDWKSKSGGFFFRKLLPDGRQKIFLLDDEKGLIKDLGVYYESPVISSDGRFWVYSDYDPKINNKSEVRGGEPGDKGLYVFHGRVSQVLGWDQKSPAVLYFSNDKILGYEVVNRARQIFNLPFQGITVVGFGYPSILYFYNDTEENDSGLKLYDPERKEKEDVIDNKKFFIKAASNRDDSKFIIFVPRKKNNPLGEGEVYFVDSKTATSTKLTRDTGRRVLLELNLNNNFSPDGKYFIYEKLKLKYSNIKRSDLWIIGGKKEVKLMDRAGHPVWIGEPGKSPVDKKKESATKK